MVLDKLLSLLVPKSGLPRDLVWITPVLARSGRFEGRRADDVVRAGIGSVLDLREEAGHDPALIARAGLHYLRLPVADRHAPSLQQLTQAADWVLRETAEDRKVLVHCRLGLRRSACTVLTCPRKRVQPLCYSYPDLLVRPGA